MTPKSFKYLEKDLINLKVLFYDKDRKYYQIPN